jgi:hypothetical protein
MAGAQHHVIDPTVSGCTWRSRGRAAGHAVPRRSPVPLFLEASPIQRTGAMRGLHNQHGMIHEAYS